jgi:hypothetical protein
VKTVSEISVENFGTIKVARWQSGGRVELELDLVEASAAFDVVERAFNSVPNTRKKSISHDRLLFEFKPPRKIKSNGERRNYFREVVSDFLKSVEAAASSNLIQATLDLNPLYRNDPRLIGG